MKPDPDPLKTMLTVTAVLLAVKLSGHLTLTWFSTILTILVTGLAYFVWTLFVTRLTSEDR